MATPVISKILFNQNGFIQRLRKGSVVPILRNATPVSAGWSLNTPTVQQAGGETADYYIETPANGGNDSNNGTSPSTPWATLGRANTVMTGQSNKKVLVGDGNYQNGTPLTISCSGTSGNRNHFKSRNYGGAHIIGTTRSSETHGVLFSGDWMIFEGFDIHGWDVNVDTGLSAVTFLAGADNNILRHCIMRDIGNSSINTSFGMTGVYTTGASHNNTIERNLFYNIARSAAAQLDHGIYAGEGSSGWIIRNNIFRQFTRGYAIQLYPTSVSNFKIMANTFHLSLTTSQQTQFTMLLGSGFSGQIENNIFWASTTNNITIGVGTTVSGSTCKNNYTDKANTMYSENTSGYDNQSGFTYSGNMVSQSNPFVAVGSNNFHLTSGAAARGAGLNLLSDVPDDFDGVARPNGAHDIGAYQFV